MALGCSTPRNPLSKQTPLELPEAPAKYAANIRMTAGGRGFLASGGEFQAGGPEERRPKQTKMAAVRLPPVRERKRPNGDGFSPRPMIRKRKGATPKGGRWGKETAATRLPTAPRKSHVPRVPQGSGPGNNDTPYPRERSEQNTPGSFPHPCGNIIL